MGVLEWNCDGVVDQEVLAQALQEASGHPRTSNVAAEHSGESRGDGRTHLVPPVSRHSMAEEGTEPLCIICMERPANATFVHESIGHTVCCLDCATQVRRRNDRCPVCRQSFERVIRNYMMG